MNAPIDTSDARSTLGSVAEPANAGRSGATGGQSSTGGRSSMGGSSSSSTGGRSGSR
jgi:hypothetical protein